MNNTVVLYKVQWTASSLNQPYFMSDTARDSYLESLVQKIVLENVNISLKPNLFLELIIPLDITESESYNYAKIVYNNKTYFANITDYEQISVNRTKLYLERHSLSEQTNFLDLFHQFKISQCTLNDYKYGLNANICKQEFRTIQKIYDISHKTNCYLEVVGENELQKTGIEYYKFYILFVDVGAFAYNPVTDEALYNDNIYGEKVQYKLIFIPADNTKIYYKRFIPDELGGGTFEEDFISNAGISQSLLNELSPYIKAMFFTSLPLSKIHNDGLTLSNYYNLLDYNSTIKANPAIKFYQTIVFHGADSSYYTIDYFLQNNKQLFTKLLFRCYSVTNEIEIPVYEYLTMFGTITIKFNYVFSINGTQCIGIIYSGNTESVKGNKTRYFQVSLGDSTTFLLDSDSNFEAENKYYQALTRNAVKQNIASGLVQSGTQIVSGAIQAGTGLANGNPFSVSEGSANVVRGIGTIADTVLKNKYYKRERSLMAENEKAKPDQLMQGASASIEMYTQNGSHVLIEEEPFEEDYNDFISNLHYYGVETYLFRESILLDELSYDNHFFLQATAIIKDNGYIERQIYDDLYSLLSNGCRYFIVAEQ